MGKRYRERRTVPQRRLHFQFLSKNPVVMISARSLSKLIEVRDPRLEINGPSKEDHGRRAVI